MSAKEEEEAAVSSPPTKKPKRNNKAILEDSDDDDDDDGDKKMKPFSSLGEKSGFPMTHTLEVDYWSFSYAPRSKFELILMGIAGAIRDKPDWWNKVNDDTITAKWKTELSEGHALPESIRTFLWEILDDGDPRGFRPEDDRLLYQEPEEDDLIAHGFEEEASSEEQATTDNEYSTKDLLEILYTDLQVQADEDGYLIANPKIGVKPQQQQQEESNKNEKDDEEMEEEKEEENEEDKDRTSQQELLLALYEYALKECQWMAKKFEPGPSHPAAVQGVYCRNDLDGTDLHKNLLQEIGKLREKPAIGHTKEDRHPGTPAMVDLVHPSMYCYERGKTPILDNAGAEALEAPDWKEFFGSTCQTKLEDDNNNNNNNKKSSSNRRNNSSYFKSKQGLQWLPSEFKVDSTTNQCHINSYINNLHPLEHSQLYQYIGQLFVHCLPLLEDTLNDKAIMEPPLRLFATFTEKEENEEDQDNDHDDYEYYGEQHKSLDPIPEVIPKFEPYQTRDIRRRRDNNKPKTPTSPTKNNISLKDRPLQVITKIASLELTPDEHPMNPMGRWHVEGCLDERIVATACCYLQTCNIQGGDLQFRIAVGQPAYEQGDAFGVQAEFGISDGSRLVQPRGSCSPRAGQVLAWSNVWQHRVDQVELVDKTQPGERTILCFFLVDPTLRIRSTATVPPQQKAWLYPEEQQSVLTNELSELVAAKVATNVATVGMTYQDADERRKRLMDERRGLEEDAEYAEDEYAEYAEHEYAYARGFSLCEH